MPGDGVSVELVLLTKM